MIKYKNKQGFTIIEVVLVLAIAGLIFLMVFIALPALQRNQRDTLRKRQVSTLLDAYKRCLSLNKNTCRISTESAPQMYERLIGNYIADIGEITDPSTGQPYVMYSGSYTDIMGEGAAENLEIGTVGFDWSAGCDGDVMFDYPGLGQMSSTAAFIIRLEGGGTYCVSNNNKS